MKRVFADAFFFFALWSSDDFFHHRAVGFLQSFRGTLVTTRWVLVEVADGLAGTPERLSVKRLFDQLETGRATVVVGFGDALYQRGLTLYDKRPDKEWSLTDCISFVVMEDEGLREALTGDRHFVQAGFQAIFGE